MQLERASQECVIVPAGAADAMQEVVHLIDQRLEQGPRVSLDVWEQRANGGIGRLPDRLGQGDDGLLAALPAILQYMRLVLDLAAQTKDGVRIAHEQALLLLFEQTEQGTVFDQFLSQTFGYELPVHNQ